ncbi:MAG: hypothetical protein Q7K26_00480 [bacterium]|nr:hypothetical protein [bacterium]
MNKENNEENIYMFVVAFSTVVWFYLRSRKKFMQDTLCIREKRMS